jgi:2-dehydropantoate 2-reductase
MAVRIAVVGVGAIGSYFGGHMVRAGLDVTLIDQWPENVEHIRGNGITIEEFAPEDRLVVPADPLHIVDAQRLIRERPIDIAFISVKSYDTPWATQLILPYLARDGVLVSLQNAVNEPVIDAVAGGDRTYGCAVASLSCDLLEAGRVKRMSPDGHVAVGAFGKADPARARQIAEVLRHAEKADAIDNLLGVKWSKLVVNAMRNGLSAMTGMTGLERDTDPVTIALSIRLGAQTIRVARALGHELVDTGFSFDALVAADDGDAEAAALVHRRMMEITGGRNADQKPSMAQDIRKGRRTETDAINGYVARLGRELGIETGAHQQVHELLQRIERGEIKPSRELAVGIA